MGYSWTNENIVSYTNMVDNILALTLIILVQKLYFIRGLLNVNVNVYNARSRNLSIP